MTKDKFIKFFKKIKTSPAVSITPKTYRALYYDLEADKGKAILQVKATRPKRKKT